MDEEVVEMTPEEYSTLTGDSEYKFIWDQEMTFSLIEEYRNHLQDFLYPQGQMIRDVWERISLIMQAKGYDLSAAACDQKWRQLKKTYKFNISGGRKTKAKWVYFEDLEDILGNDQITRRTSWEQRSMIKKGKEIMKDPDSSNSYTHYETLDDEYFEGSEQACDIAKQSKEEKTPRWFENFLKQYQEEEREKRRMLQKMHGDLVALEREKCVLLESLIKKIPKTEPIPKIVDAVSLSQEMFEDEM